MVAFILKKIFKEPDTKYLYWPFDSITIFDDQFEVNNCFEIIPEFPIDLIYLDIVDCLLGLNTSAPEQNYIPVEHRWLILQVLILFY